MKQKGNNGNDDDDDDHNNHEDGRDNDPVRLHTRLNPVRFLQLG